MSFAQLKAITEQARQMRAEDRAAPLVDCPLCGHRLDVNSRGVLNCDVGHWRSDGAAIGAR